MWALTPLPLITQSIHPRRPSSPAIPTTDLLLPTLAQLHSQSYALPHPLSPSAIDDSFIGLQALYRSSSSPQCGTLFLHEPPSSRRPLSPFQCQSLYSTRLDSTPLCLLRIPSPCPSLALSRQTNCKPRHSSDSISHGSLGLFLSEQPSKEVLAGPLRRHASITTNWIISTPSSCITCAEASTRAGIAPALCFTVFFPHPSPTQNLNNHVDDGRPATAAAAKGCRPQQYPQ